MNENSDVRFAPDGPGIPARWTSSAKTGIGTAISLESQVWFTLSQGIFNEIYYPRIDQACVRDMGFLVTDGIDFFSEERVNTSQVVEWLEDGVPAFKLVNTCSDGQYQIEKLIITDPARDTVLQQVQFHPQKGALSDYHLYVVLAPHLENHGDGNTGWIGEFEGTQLLFAQRNDCALALACSAPWTKRSVGYVGSSDGWQDLKSHRQVTWDYTRAENGDIALTAEIDLSTSKGEFVLALGFGKNSDEAARNAIASLRDGFDKAKNEYISGWQEWTKTKSSLKLEEISSDDLTLKSLAVLRTHESKSSSSSGALIASLAIPWGFNDGDKNQGGYHIAWSRDMVESASALLAAGVHEDVRRTLSYLMKTQLSDGHWLQNMWMDGTRYWDGIQMDETALPILLVDLARREKALAEGDLEKFWPMVKKAATYLACNGPVSPQDRWEENPGYTPFSVATEIAALLAAAEIADLIKDTSTATYLREIADVWNDSIDRWMYVTGTDWCEKFEVEGYYVHIAPETSGTDRDFSQEIMHLKNVKPTEEAHRVIHLISPDALALVRFGLRSADDSRIRDTVKVIDALTKVETPSGDTWHRYNHDGYGEHEDGSPFDGTGVGRGWPLLTGERGHYELLAGRAEIAKKLLSDMKSFANESGFIPEQVWDSPDIPERNLYCGRPSGSVMPLVWAHAEYLKLRRSLREGKIFDQPPQTVQRYLKDKIVSPHLTWRLNHRLRSLPPGKILRIELMAPAVVRWSVDGWKTSQDIDTQDSGLGIHFADLPTQTQSEGTQVKFTFYWLDLGHWKGYWEVNENTVHVALFRREELSTLERSETNGK